MTVGNAMRATQHARWAAADEAHSRITAVRRTIDAADGSAAADSTPVPAAPQPAKAKACDPVGQAALRDGLSELDAVRHFLHERISTENTRFVDDGSRDEDLRTALEHGLSELETVRRRLVRTLSTSASVDKPEAKPANAPAPQARPTGRPPSATTRGGVKKATTSTTSGGGGATSTATSDERARKILQEHAQRLFGNAGRPQTAGASRSASAQRAAAAAAAAAQQQQQQQQQQPDEPAPGDSLHGSNVGLRSTATRLQQRPMSATSRSRSFQQQRRGSGDAPAEASKPATTTTTTTAGKPFSRTRPTSAPARARNAAEPTKVSAGVDHTKDGEAGEDGAPGQWNRYQDWAQRVMNRVHTRRIAKHRQALEKERMGSSVNSNSGNSVPEATPTAPPVAKAEPTPPPRTTAQRPSSAAFGGLRRAQQAAAQGNATGAPSRPQSATVRTASTVYGSTTTGTSSTPSTSASAAPVTRDATGGLKLDSSAQQLREQGNIAFQQKRYADASDAYSRAINIEPHSEALLCNRAAAYLMLNRFNAALQDAHSAIAIDPHHVKAHWRAAKACLYLGQTDNARSLYAQAQKLTESKADAEAIAAEARAADLVDRCRRAIRLRDYADALKAADQVLEVFPATGPSSVTWQCLRAETFLHTDAAEALTIITKLNHEDPNSAEAWYLRAKAVFYTGHDAVSTSAAIGFIARCREHEAKHSRAAVLQASIETFAKLRDEGNSAYAAGRWQEAYVAYTKCLAVDPCNSSLKAIILCNRSAVCIQCERWKDALDDINNSITCNPQNAKSYTRRARIFQQQGNHDSAVKDLQLAAQMYPSSDNQERLQQAIDARNRARNATSGGQQQQQQQQGGAYGGANYRFFSFAGSAAGGSTGPQRPSTAGASRSGAQPRGARPQSAKAAAKPSEPSHYEVLQVPRTADDKTITRAYRDAALKWHPDKWMTASEAEKEKAETVFKQVSTAYGVLRDGTKRRQYDLSSF